MPCVNTQTNGILLHPKIEGNLTSQKYMGELRWHYTEGQIVPDSTSMRIQSLQRSRGHD